LDIVRQNGGRIPLDAIGRILLGLLAIDLVSAFRDCYLSSTPAVWLRSLSFTGDFGSSPGGDHH